MGSKQQLQQVGVSHVGMKPRRKLWLNLFAASLAIGALMLIAVFSAEPKSANADQKPASLADAGSGNRPIKPVNSGSGGGVQELHELLAATPEQRSEIDIARINLLCATGLPGAEGLDIEAELATLDIWAAAVKAETERNLHQYFADPGNFENSEGYFRILTLITILQQDFGVRYNPERIYSPDFTDCRDVFLHGITRGSGDADHAGGTCVSMPVVYVAVARRLGYPVRLVTTKEHVFARWESETDRFNIEATSQGLNVYEDEFYETWPSTLSRAELASGAYLRSLSPDEEMGLFMAASGYVLEDTGKKREATIAFAYAHMLDPLSIDSFDNLGRSVIRRLKDYPAVQQRPGLGRPGGQRPPRGGESMAPPPITRSPAGIP